jgi:hypothetical protein
MAGILARFGAGWADPKLNGARGMPVFEPCPRRIRLRHVRAMTTAGTCARLRDLICRRVEAS